MVETFWSSCPGGAVNPQNLWWRLSGVHALVVRCILKTYGR